MIDANAPSLHDILPGIRSRANLCDRTGNWPDDDMRILASIGAMRWAIPTRFGGEGLSPIDLHFRYEAIASASLATALILSQRDSAIGLIDGGENESLKNEMLAKLANNEIFATVGIAQLTTSRQRGGPALVADPFAGGLALRGIIPWSSGADRAEVVVAGAVVQGQGQILFALPTDLAGVRVAPPLPLVALGASHTSSIELANSRLDERFLIAGPLESVLSTRKTFLPIGQAFLALGLSRGAIPLIDQHDSDRARELVARFESQFQELRRQVLDQCAASAPVEPGRSAQLRGACNNLALRVTHAAVALYKGTALRTDHPAQRLAREAMFLLVWSCPDPVIDCTVDLLSEGN